MLGFSARDAAALAKPIVLLFLLPDWKKKKKVYCFDSSELSAVLLVTAGENVCNSRRGDIIDVLTHHCVFH